MFISDGGVQINMDFDDCEMDAATIFFNSPGGPVASESMTSGYQSFEEDSNALCGGPDIDMEMEDINGSPTSEEFQLRKPTGLRRCLSLDMRKRMIENEFTSSPTCFRQPSKFVPKMIKEEMTDEVAEGETKERYEEQIKSAVERLADGGELVADCSRPYSLPTVCGKHKDLKSITPQTLADLLSGQYNRFTSDFRIFDCRYPYEYKGGHIQGAENIYTKESIDNELQRTEKDRPSILIFHCEFSSQRAPRLLRYLRSQDRLLNSASYPSLYYPEVYILDGGYKAFYEQTEGLCQPPAYTPMLHQDHGADLRHFRVKSKSWTAGEKPREKPREKFFSRSRPIRF
ncbi:hypothetical protein SNE40_007877 [Patella caerulea]|uniref:M-phase inducer phosphatase n=1 Tax=Patella caerulea TaxID=87958 RepID=A0AAN8K4H3_PATCE